MYKKKIFTKLKIFVVFILIVVFSSMIYINKNNIFNIMGKKKLTQSTIQAWDTNKVTPVTSLDGITVPVPKGYTASSVENERYVNSGLVIYEGEEAVNSSNIEEAKKTRNQWVWVPVLDVSRIYKEENGIKQGKIWYIFSSGRTEIMQSDIGEPKLTEYDNEKYFSQYGLLGMTTEKFYQEMQLEFENTIESIKTYGGFYIGRYETGNLNQKVPVVRRMNEDISNQTWYEMYAKAKYLGANRKVKSNMIWECLWDETLQWFVDSEAISGTGEKITYNKLLSTESEKYGNYSSSEFMYETISGQILQKRGIVKIPTGSSEYTRINNTYDISGNVSEVMLSAWIDRRICHGGNYKPGSSYLTGGQSYSSYDIKDFCGFRAYLYIK